MYDGGSPVSQRLCHVSIKNSMNQAKGWFVFSVFAEEEDFTSTLRDRSHIDETLRLATEEKSRDYAGDEISFQILIFNGKRRRLWKQLICSRWSPSTVSSSLSVFSLFFSRSWEVKEDLPHIHQAHGAGLQVQWAEAARDLRYPRGLHHVCTVPTFSVWVALVRWLILLTFCWTHKVTVIF